MNPIWFSNQCKILFRKSPKKIAACYVPPPSFPIPQYCCNHRVHDHSKHIHTLQNHKNTRNTSTFNSAAATTNVTSTAAMDTSLNLDEHSATESDDTIQTQTQKMSMRGADRFFTISKNYSNNIIVPMTIEVDDMDLFLERLPRALHGVFMENPRMRVLESEKEDEFATDYFHHEVTLAQVKDCIEMIPLESHEYQDPLVWKQHSQVLVDQAFNRSKEFPFHLTVLFNKTPDGKSTSAQARLILKSLHSQTDGIGNSYILHSILEKVANNGVYKSFYKCPEPLFTRLLEPYPISRRIISGLMSLFGPKILRDKFMSFESLLPVREDQGDFTLPPREEPNSGKVLFANGTKENYEKARKKCKEEGTTVGAASTAAYIACFMRSKMDLDPTFFEKKEEDNNFTLALDTAYNMRDRVKRPLRATAVGHYSTVTQLSTFAEEGINATSRFWDVATRAKNSMNTELNSLSMRAFLIALDTCLHSKAKDPLLKVPRGVVSDGLISHCGTYAFPIKHELEGTNGKKSSITVKELYGACSFPALGPTNGVWVISLDYFTYSFLHKYEETLGNTFFESFVNCMESLDDIDTNATLMDVCNQMKNNTMKV